MRLFIKHLLQEQLLKQKHPKEVYPAEYDTRGNRNEDTNDKSEESAFLKPGAPSYHKLNYPVYTGDDEQKQLDESGLSVEPGHLVFLLVSDFFVCQ